MKTKITVITLSILALIASSCGQTTKKQAETAIENLKVRQYAGIYTFGDRDSEAPSGIVYVYPETDSTALFHLFKIIGVPSYNVGEIDGRITIQDGKATFRERYGDYENDCVLRFEFNNDTLTVAEAENDCDCPFGHNVYVHNTFLRTTSEIPQYYINLCSAEVYFSEWQENNDNNDELSDTKTTDEEGDSFIMPSDWEGVKCRQYNEDGGYTAIQKCTFPNANLQQVYDIIKKKVSDMKTELPVNNMKYSIDEKDAVVTYTYKAPKYLHIELSYAGGETIVEIIEKKSETQSKITYSAD